MTPRARTRLPDPPAAIATVSPHRRDAELEAWICERLGLRDLYAGVTTTEIRRDRLKVVLLKRGLADSHAGRFGGECITWRAAYERLYHEELTTEFTKGGGLSFEGPRDGVESTEETGADRPAAPI